VVQKLTIVVTCTDRKSAQPEPHLMLRNLPSRSRDERVDLWKARLESAPSRAPLRNLYCGESWTQALRLEASAHAAGFDPTLIVASAGLGLVEVDVLSPSYAATFSPRQVDSVGSTQFETSEWWQSLAPRSTSARNHLNAPTLLVLSKNYADAMAQDLNQLDGRDDVVIFGGSDAVPTELRVPADRGLRAALGGTATSLNLRTAIAWVNRLPAPTISGNRDHAAWRTWASTTSQAEVYNRQTLSDLQVLDFVLNARRADPALSKSRALRLLRDSGHACEQRRFSELFQSAMENA